MFSTMMKRIECLLKKAATSTCCNQTKYEESTESETQINLQIIVRLLDGNVIRTRTVSETIEMLDEDHQQDGAVEACWAHNPEVGRSKLPPANFFETENHLQMLTGGVET